MMKKQKKEESLQSEMSFLVDELDRLTKEEAELRSEIKRLSKAEDHKAGVFHAAKIHELKQKRMDLQFQITYNQSRLKQLRNPF